MGCLKLTYEQEKSPLKVVYGGLYASEKTVQRWTSTDPKNQYFSPYVGMGNNPVSGVDPDGGENVPIDMSKYVSTESPKSVNSEPKGFADWGRMNVDGKNVYKWFGEGVKVDKGWEFVSTDFDALWSDAIKKDPNKAYIEFAPGSVNEKFLINRSSYPIYFMPDTDTKFNGKMYYSNKVYTLGPNLSFSIPIDAVGVPSLNKSEVYKVVDGSSVIVTKTGIDYKSRGISGWGGNLTTGGWTTEPYFTPLLNLIK